MVASIIPPTIDRKSIQIQLPITSSGSAKSVSSAVNYLDCWESLSVRWLEKFDPSAFLMKAQFPSGWSVEQCNQDYFEKKSIKVFDHNGDVKAYAWIDLKDQTADVHFPKDQSIPNEKFDTLIAEYKWVSENSLFCEEIPNIRAVEEDLKKFVGEHPEVKSQFTGLFVK